MQYDFKTLVDRTGTGALKWEKYKGRDILPMWVADMDFPTCPHIHEALVKLASGGVYGYTVPTEKVLSTVTAYLARHGYANPSPDWIVFSPGLVPALNFCVRCFLKEGDEVATITPVYPPIINAPTQAGHKLHTTAWHRADGTWKLDFDRLEASITPHTRMLILCNPHNPTGRVCTRKELERIGDIARRHDLLIVSDEIHCDLTLDGRRHIPIATISPDLADRTISLMAPSKTYNVPGLSCSFLVIPNADLRQRYLRSTAGFISELNVFGYTALVTAFNEGEAWRQQLLRTFERHRDIVDRFVRERLAPVTYIPQEATYLAWLDVSALGLPNPAAHFEAHGVGLNAGNPFGDPNFLRLNFGTTEARLVQALERMEKAVQAALAARK